MIAQRRSTQITNNGGGVMTDEVGVITGDLTLNSEADSTGEVVLRVQYRDADEWYTVTGGRCTIASTEALDPVHLVAAGLLHRPEG